MLTVNAAMLPLLTHAIERALSPGGTLHDAQRCPHGWAGPWNSRPCSCKQQNELTLGDVVMDVASPGDGSAWMLVRLRLLDPNSETPRVDEDVPACCLQVSTLDGSWVWTT